MIIGKQCSLSRLETVSALPFLPTNRYSGDYTDSLGHLQTKAGQNNNGYIPYVDYARDYSPPPQTLTQLRSLNNNNSNNSSYSNNLSNNLTTSNSQHMNGQLPNGNLSLQRNRQEIRQENGLPNIPNSMSSLPNGLLSEYFNFNVYPHVTYHKFK